MSTVTAYCQISGCSPINHTLWWGDIGLDLEDNTDEGNCGPLVTEAFRSLMNSDETEGQDAITVIGSATKEGKLAEDMENNDTKEAMDPSHSKIIVQPCVVDDFIWEYGSVRPLTDNANESHDASYTVSFGANIMVLNSALEILRTATDGRMTPERFWRLAMANGRGTDVIHDVDYEKEMETYSVWEEDTGPSVVPAMTIEEVVDLEKLGDVEIIKRTIVHQGHFWVWMRPDCFPRDLDSISSQDSININTPSTAHKSSIIELLPPEVLTMITRHVTSFYDVLSLSSTSRSLRTKMLGVKSNMDAVARAWIYSNAPWYIPYAEKHGTPGSKDHNGVPLGFAYLRQCRESGSMRNRERIWRTVLRMEAQADAIGV